MLVSPWAYCAVFLVPALLPIAWWLGQLTGLADLFTVLPPLVLYGLFPLLDQMIGQRQDNADLDDTERQWKGGFRWIALACLPLQLTAVLWGGYVLFALQPFGPVGAIVWTLSVGYVGGILAINVAHELIHKRSKLDQAVGGLLLSTVCYAGFKVEHVRGHHVWVATPQDPSTARYDQSLYQFLPQAIRANFRNAWRLERNRLKQQNLSWWRHELIPYYAVSALLLIVFALIAGWQGALYFVGQSATAFIGLEVINYVEHYGLRRRQLPDGRYERPTPNHSWNTSHTVTNLVLLQLGRHSDHHANATRPYPLLQHHVAAPQLPAGYPAMYLLALMPPLWKKIMNPRVEALNAANSTPKLAQ